MGTHVYWLVELELKADENQVRALLNEMVQSARDNEPDTLMYEWHLSPDGRTCHLYERYADSAAVVTHMRTFGQKFAGRFLKALKPVRFQVYGSPDAAAKESLAGINPVYMQPGGGFARD